MEQDIYETNIFHDNDKDTFLKKISNLGKCLPIYVYRVANYKGKKDEEIYRSQSF